MIGIFDSGLGGLTVLKEVKALLPNYNYIYLGDTLHVPYGNRSDAAVFDLTKKACDFLFAKGCKFIVIACNTATAKALSQLQHEYLFTKRREMKNDNLGIWGVVKPVVEHFCEHGGAKIAVVGTAGTINSKIYQSELSKLGYSGKVIAKSTPLLVPLIEENWQKKPVFIKILRMYLNMLKLNNATSLILGCTHYPIILKLFKQVMGKSCYVPNPAEIIALSLKKYLQQHPEIDDSLMKNNQTFYYVTDLNENFNNVARIFIKEKIKFDKVNLD